MAEPITQTRLRALAAVHPEQGRVLSVFLNLDPAQFATPAARSSAITSVMTAAAHKMEESDGLTHDERIALRDDVERVRAVLADSGVASNTSRPSSRRRAMAWPMNSTCLSMTGGRLANGPWGPRIANRLGKPSANIPR